MLNSGFRRRARFWSVADPTYEPDIFQTVLIIRKSHTVRFTIDSSVGQGVMSSGESTSMTSSLYKLRSGVQFG